MTAPCSKSIKAQVFAAGEDRPRGPAAACGPGASLVNDRALHTGSVGPRLRFSIDGHTALLLDAMNMKWTVISPGDTGIEEWENDQGLAEYFRKTSVGDCNHWFQEFLEHWEERLEPEPTAPTLLSSDNEQSTDLQLMAWVIPSIFVSLVLIGITIRNYRRSRTTQGQSEGCVYPELFLPLPPLPVSPLLSGSSAP
ncbi:Retinoic acid early transcript 1E, partial [Camelus dromedarius]